MIKRLSLLKAVLACLLFSGPKASGQETFPRNGPYDERTGNYAFINATIATSPSVTISQATLLVENGRIAAVGKNVPVPKNTVVYDLKNKHIYASFIDLFSSYGMPPNRQPERSSGPQLNSSKKGVFGWNQAVHSEERAAALFSPDKEKATEYRNAGFGTVLTHYQDGIVRGTGSLTTLTAEAATLSTLKADASAHFSFSKGSSGQQYPTSVMGAVALLRQTYYDAEWYQNGGSREEQNLSLEAMGRLRKLPAIFEANNKWALLRADKIGDEFGIRYIIKGGGDEYQRILEIKAANVPVIVPLNFPETYDVADPWDAEVITLAEMKHWEMAPGNAAALEKAGVEFAFTANGLKNAGDFLGNIRKAVRYGLSKTRALEALTTTPAKLVGAEKTVGTLATGQIANFLVTSGDIFEDGTELLENWIQGKRYLVASGKPDLAGTYDFSINGQQKGTLAISGTRSKPELKLRLNDTLTVTPRLSAIGDLLTITFQTEKGGGSTRLTGWFEGNRLRGSGELPGGEKVQWAAGKTDTPVSLTEKKDSSGIKPETGAVVYPFVGLGQETLPGAETILFKNATVWTMEADGKLTETDVLVRGGKITQVGKKITAPQGARVIDATGRHLTPGLVDEHSHIALFGVNEGSQSSSAEVRMADALNPEDVNIYRQLAGGVTTSQLLHGSANAIGGQSAVIKLKWGESADKLLLPEARYIKFALGENVKQSNWGEQARVRYPQTRMGVEQVYYDHFIRARAYDQSWKAYNKAGNKKEAPRRDLELEALAEILRGERHITCHSYVQSEINMLMHVADSLKFRINTFTHILEGYKLADKMAERKIGGSAFADWWAYKMEVKEAIPYNAALMAREGITVAINSDDAEMARRLNQEAAKTIAFGGVSEIDALKMVTLNPARLLRLDHRIGSIKVGKDADLVLWTDHPLSIYAQPVYTVIEGCVYFSTEGDLQKQKNISQEKARLIQKSLDAKAAGAATQAPQSVRPRMWHCEDIIGAHVEHHDH
ncbi:amidohydrolase family protein [Ravibacter arvi]|uniref:Amidohydrolase family protein n=1 Tax=Ravibacter arvi TaxID=2051041 RepID=A0ABP8M6H8_9BACT